MTNLFEVLDTVDIGDFVKELRLLLNDSLDVQADARLPIFEVGWGSTWDSEWEDVLDADIKIPYRIRVNLAGANFDVNMVCILGILCNPFLLPLYIVAGVLGDPLLPSSENWIGRNSGPESWVGRRTVGISVLDCLTTISITFVAINILTILYVICPEGAKLLLKLIMRSSVPFVNKSLLEKIAGKINADGLSEENNIDSKINGLISDVSVIKDQTSETGMVTWLTNLMNTVIKGGSVTIGMIMDYLEGDLFSKLQNLDTIEETGKPAGDFISNIRGFRGI